MGIDPAPRPRPNPALWVWYAFWGPLPKRYRTWVLYDVTCASWVVRHLLRILTIAALPVAAVALFLPGPEHVRLLTALVAGCGGFLFTAVWINEATEHRLVQAGWDWGLGPAVRQRRAAITTWLRTVRKL